MYLISILHTTTGGYLFYQIQFSLVALIALTVSILQYIDVIHQTSDLLSLALITVNHG